MIADKKLVVIRYLSAKLSPLKKQIKNLDDEIIIEETPSQFYQTEPINYAYINQLNSQKNKLNQKLKAFKQKQDQLVR